MNGQAAWCGALLDPRHEIPAALITWNGSDPAQRFAVYRNNVTVSLLEAIADTFPVCQALLGAARFRDLARAFVRAQPPRSPVLARYGAGFADFIATHPLAAAWPYLPDLVRLEMACLDALHAGDAEPMDAGVLAAVLGEPERLPALRLAVHPSLATLDSPYAVVSLWAAPQGDETPTRVAPSVAESVWVLRRERSVRVLPMAAGDVRFIAALRAGVTLGEAAATAAAVFWNSGQTKVEGFAIDLVSGTVDLGWPRCLWRDYPRASPRRDHPERLLMERKLKRGAPAAPSLPDSGAIRVKAYWAGIA